jgi:hypothetical protein
MQQADGALTAVFQGHLDDLEEELRGARRDGRVRAAVDELMRVQALFTDDADAAVACLDRVAAGAGIGKTLRPLARDLFASHRERIARIRTSEVARAGYVAQRMRARRAGHQAVPGLPNRP